MCTLQISLNTEDPQYQEKRLVAQRNGKLAVQVFNVCNGPFDIMFYFM